MKNFKVVLFFGIILLVFAAFGYSKAVPNSPGQNSGQGPRIVIEPESWDFGEVEFGKVVEKEFSLKNEGNEKLEINRVSTSCGCTKAEVDKKELEPDEEGRLLVTYDSGAMGKTIIGKRLERFVYLRSNDRNSPQVEVIIYARVK